MSLASATISSTTIGPWDIQRSPSVAASNATSLRNAACCLVNFIYNSKADKSFKSGDGWVYTSCSFVFNFKNFSSNIIGELVVIML